MTRTLRRANAAVWRVVDWRYIASLAAAGLVAAIIASLITQADARRDADDRAMQALQAQTESRQAASRRIDLLNGRITRLDELLVDAETDSAELRTAVAALTEQIRRMGGRPIVTTISRPSAPPTTTTTRAPTTSPSPTTTAQPPTTTTTPPPTTTTTQPCRGVQAPVLGCVG